MFDKATRIKLRFATSRGYISVEDLWDMNLKAKDGYCLDELAKALYKELQTESISFVEEKSEADAITQLKFDIVKYIIDYKLAMRDRAKKVADTKERKQKIMAIMAKKQDASLEEASMEDLQKMLEDL